MTDGEKNHWSLRLAEAGGALIGGVVVALFTVSGTLAGLPVIRAAIYGLVVLAGWSLCVLHAWRRAARVRSRHSERDARVPCGHLKRHEQERNP